MFGGIKVYGMRSSEQRVFEQELVRRATTGVIYWEGEVIVEGTRVGEPVAGLGYVELTGYAD
ncbi:hypothetical protein BH20CHL4_BH20CHL4_16170 [soil metagenome]